MTYLALTYPDGRVGIMQLVEPTDDAGVAEIIGKMVDQPTDWVRITPEQAAQIRASRPKSEEDSSAPVSTDSNAMKLIEQMAAVIAAQEARLGQLEQSHQEALRITRAVERAVEEKAGAI